MLKEKSCGAVIYKKKDNELFFLILKHKKGHYGLCKGHTEGNETEIQTALREIKEETNLEVEIDENFRETEIYSPFEGTIKEVIYFIAFPVNNEIIAQESEIKEILWCKYDEAINLITHKNTKNIIKKAYQYIK